MNSLDLFSGIGGISLALGEYVRTIGYVEIDKYAQSVLLSRMADGSIEVAPIFRDITKLDGTKLRGSVDIISGGFPCQDISVAGNGKGLAGQRSGLFFEIIRITKEIRPSFVFLENVPAIRTRGLEQVIKAFTEIGYDCRWTMLTAASVGANHKRERWFLLAHSNGNRYGNKNKQRWSSGQDWKGQADTGGNGEVQSVADRVTKKHDHACDESWWAVEPSMGRVVNGVSNRVDRIKCLGNSVVPLQVKTAFKRLLNI